MAAVIPLKHPPQADIRLNIWSHIEPVRISIEARRIVRKPLLWLAVLYVVVGVVYAVLTPIFEKPDEEYHYGYIRYLREHGSMPPLRSSEGLSFEYKQPPLYYVVASVLTSWMPVRIDVDRELALNPYVDESVPGLRNDNRNVFLHPPDMSPLILGARLVSLMFGLGTMLVSYHVARQLYSSPSAVPVTVAAVVGFQPKFLYMATAVNNDAAVAFFGALTLALLLDRFINGAFPRFAVLAGIVLGLASITKVSSLAFFPLTGLVLLFIHRGFRRGFFRDGVIIVGVALLIGGWWYARNAVLYDDPLTIATHVLSATKFEPLGERIAHDLTSIERTFWANQARTFVSPIWLDRVLIWWGRISLILLVLGVLVNHKSSRPKVPLLAALFSWPAAFLFLLVGYWNRSASWPFGRLLFPAIAPIGLLLVVGWEQVVPPRWLRPVLTVNATAMVSICILVPIVTLYPLFHPSRERRAEEVERPVGTVYTAGPEGSQVARLVGYNPLTTYALPGRYFPIELCWEPLGQTEVPYAVLVQLLDLSQLGERDSPGVVGRRETYPGLGSRPTDRWALHRTFCDEVLVWVDPAAPTPLGAGIEVVLIEPETGDRLSVVDAQGESMDLVFVGSTSVLAPGDLPAAMRPVQYTLGNAIGLVNIDQPWAVDSSLGLTITWQSLQAVPYDATVFIRARGMDGEVLAQVDRQPHEGRYPTSYWIPGQVITDAVSLPFAPGKTDKLSFLELGMYVWPSMRRLKAADASGSPQRDNVIVYECSPSTRPRAST